jgi:myo-inositol 2-dehydrogenase/D-chiro-inositol 1-dehydrogenase
MFPAPSAPQGGEPSRRDFIQGASAVVAGGLVLGANAHIARAAFGGGSGEIKVGLIGCGGRGTEAAMQALKTEGPVTLWAMGDAFKDRLDRSLSDIKNHIEEESGNERMKDRLRDTKIDVPEERQFVGFDAYQQVIDSGVDLVILATTPGFRPIHFEAAVKAGKHVFAEKPVAVDAPGVRRFLAANEEAKKKNLMVAIGLQRHHQAPYLDTVKRLQDGAIGDIMYTRVYWNGTPLWWKNRENNMTEMEYQMRNWYYYVWLCGDHIVEQHIHNIDVSNWLRNMHPVEAQGMGGRQVRTGKEFGQIYDHHCVEFTYPDGTKMFSQCRHMNDTAGSVSEFAHGTKGWADVSGMIYPTEGDRWRYRGQGTNPYQVEHDDLFAAIRKGDVYNEGEFGAHSTMSAILGRMATYSGKIVKWDDAINSEHDMSPKHYAFDAEPPVLPNNDGYYPVAVPGEMDPMMA